MGAQVSDELKERSDAMTGSSSYEPDERAVEREANRLEEAAMSTAERYHFGLSRERDEALIVYRALNEAYRVVGKQASEAQAALVEAREALAKIAEGRGAFSRDPLTHAANVIDEAKATAAAALAREPDVSALRAFGERLFQATIEAVRPTCGCPHCDEVAPGWSRDEIVARVLGERGQEGAKG